MKRVITIGDKKFKFGPDRELPPEVQLERKPSKMIGFDFRLDRGGVIKVYTRRDFLTAYETPGGKIGTKILMALEKDGVPYLEGEIADQTPREFWAKLEEFEKEGK